MSDHMVYWGFSTLHFHAQPNLMAVVDSLCSPINLAHAVLNHVEIRALLLVVRKLT